MVTLGHNGARTYDPRKDPSCAATSPSLSPALLCLLTGLSRLLEGPRTEAGRRGVPEGLRADGNLDGVALEDQDGATLSATTVVEEIKVLTGDLLPSQAAMSLVDNPQVNENDAEAKVAVDWRVADGVQWKYETHPEAAQAGRGLAGRLDAGDRAPRPSPG